MFIVISNQNYAKLKVFFFSAKLENNQVKELAHSTGEALERLINEYNLPNSNLEIFVRA